MVAPCYPASMTYSELVDALIKAREDQELSRRDLAQLVGVSEQVLYYWEVKRNRANSELMSRWAAALGRRFVQALPPIKAKALPEEVLGALEPLDPNEQQIVVRFAGLLPRLNKRDYGLLIGFVESMESSLSEEAKEITAGAGRKPA